MAAKKENKVVSLEQAAALVRDGDVVGLQGMGTQMAPMGMIRELIRSGKKGSRSFNSSAVLAWIG